MYIYISERGKCIFQSRWASYSLLLPSDSIVHVRRVTGDNRQMKRHIANLKKRPAYRLQFCDFDRLLANIAFFDIGTVT